MVYRKARLTACLSLAMKPYLQLYIDGSFRPKTKKGGYGVLAVTQDSKTLIASGVEFDVTNNIMEMTALKKAFESIIAYQLDEHYDVEVFCDSEYVLKGLQDWSPGWIAKGYITSTGKPVKNKELWVSLVELSKQVKVKLTWVKGHAETQLHNEVDKIVFKLTES